MDREQDIHFVYQDGVLRPEGPVDLPEGTRGVAHIRTGDRKADDDAAAWRQAQEAALARAWDDDEDAVYDSL